MKLIRFGEKNKEKPGVISQDGSIKDCSTVFKDWNAGFFRNEGLKKLNKINLKNLNSPVNSVRLGACIPRPGKIICIGLNYKDHAEETGKAIPQEPVIFMKAPNAVTGPFDDIIIPKGSKKTDWELELGIIIKNDCKNLVNKEEAREYIAGYCISNDISEREFQSERSGQWTKGKSADTFNPIGPYLVTAEELEENKGLSMHLSLNGELKQNSTTSKKIFSPSYLVYYLSQFMTLEAGDLISSGTPPGVGAAQNPPEFLKEGDLLESTIEGLGKQRHMCINE